MTGKGPTKLFPERSRYARKVRFPREEVIWPAKSSFAEVKLGDTKRWCRGAVHTMPSTEVGVVAPAAQGSSWIVGDALLEIEQRMQIDDATLVERRAFDVANSVVTQDGNGAPKPASPWVFTLLGDGDGRLFIPAGLLLGTLYNPTRFMGLHPFR